MFGLVFLICFPVIFLYQLAQFLFSYSGTTTPCFPPCHSLLTPCHTLSDVVKQSPSLLAMRYWTPYAHTRLRRYNEVSHYLKRRLNRAYRPATEYINTFSSQLLANFAE